MSEQIKLGHEKSQNYKVFVADQMICQALSDAHGATISLTFIRNDNNFIGESATVIREVNGEQIKPSGIFESQQVRVHEASALMRPDQALAAARSIIEGLMKLPPHIRRHYEIPEQIAVP